MVMLDKDKTFFERNGENLIPKVVQLNLENSPEVKIVPLTRGQSAEVYQPNLIEEDRDKKVILYGCVQPKFTEEEIDNMKPYFVEAIVLKILEYSGLKEEDNKGNITEDELKKNLEVKQGTKG
mgnify:CR=1 FL=1|jgi:hypothetical protein